MNNPKLLEINKLLMKFDLEIIYRFNLIFKVKQLQFNIIETT